MALFDRPPEADAPSAPAGGSGFMPEDVPLGSLPNEVADDIDAKLSEGEYVLPADVVRWFGVKHLEEMRLEAKEGFMRMHDDGRLQKAMGPDGSDAHEDVEGPELEAMEHETGMEPPDEGPSGGFMGEPEDEPLNFADGGLVGNSFLGNQTAAPEISISAPQVQAVTPPTLQATDIGKPSMGLQTSFQGGSIAPTFDGTSTASGTVSGNLTGTASGVGSSATGNLAPIQAAQTAGAAGSTATGNGSLPLTVGGNAASPFENLAVKAGTMGAKYAINALSNGTLGDGVAGSLGEGAAATGNFVGDLSNFGQGIGDAVAQGVGTLGDGINSALDGAWNNVTGTVDKVGSALSGNLGSIGDLAGGLAGSALSVGAGFLGNYLGGLVHGPGDEQGAWSVPVGSAIGWALGSALLGPLGTIAGTFLGSFLGKLGSGDPDIPTSFAFGGVGYNDKGATINFGQAGGMNGGNPEVGAQLGHGVTNFINSRAARDGYVVTPNAIGTNWFPSIGYKAGTGFIMAEPGHSPLEDPAYATKNANEFGEVIYGYLKDQGILVPRDQAPAFDPGQINQPREVFDPYAGSEAQGWGQTSTTQLSYGNGFIPAPQQDQQPAQEYDWATGPSNG